MEPFLPASLTLIREYIVRAHLLPANGSADWNAFSGTDGSRSIKTVQVDASGTGNNFVAAQMITNGDPVHAFHRTRYPHIHSCLLESYCRWYGTAQRPAPCWYQMHRWNQPNALSCIVHYDFRFWELRRSFTRYRVGERHCLALKDWPNHRSDK
jgi:hypothetical protein